MSRNLWKSIVAIAVFASLASGLWARKKFVEPSIESLKSAADAGSPKAAYSLAIKLRQQIFKKKWTAGDDAQGIHWPKRKEAIDYQCKALTQNGNGDASTWLDSSETENVLRDLGFAAGKVITVSATSKKDFIEWALRMNAEAHYTAVSTFRAIETHNAVYHVDQIQIEPARANVEKASKAFAETTRAYAAAVGVPKLCGWLSKNGFLELADNVDCR